MSALTDREHNAQPRSTPSNEKHMATGTENKPQEASLHKQLFDQKSGQETGAYVSPSDAIMSPASQKLAGFKQRQINKQQTGKNSTSRMLFARTPSTCSSGLDDVDGAEGKAGGS